MRVSFWRGLTSCVAGLGVFALGVLPPAHVHDEETPHGHHELVHRHLGTHSTSSSTPLFDDDDHHEHARWLSSPFTETPSAPLVGVWSVPVDFLQLLPPASAGTIELPAVEPVAHGPPGVRPPSPRAPPHPLSA
ncbi:MAG: hypothetical protein AB7I50_05410 [Vicinamibacterales bacterium]